MSKSKLGKLEEAIYKFYHDMDSDNRNGKWAGHWWDHIVRVVNNATLIINDYEEADEPELIIAAALCHDLGYAGSKENETGISSQRCLEFMLKVGYGKEEAKNAAQLIWADDSSLKLAETTDEKILYVADKLDLFGFDGTARLLVEHAIQGVTVRHELLDIAVKRQKKWLDYMLSLSTATDLVKERYAEGKALLASLAEPNADIQTRPNKTSRKAGKASSK